MSKKSLIKIFILIIALPHLGLLGQQELYMPRNIQSAYEEGTRSFNGMPGDNYWQNSSDYKIKVEVDPQENLLTGSEEITYYNNSPDTLTRIVIRLYQDILKKGGARDWSLPSDGVHDGVQISKVIIAGKEVDMEDRKNFNRSGTNLLITLNEVLHPNSQLYLSIDWNVYISDKVKIRMGAYDSTSFFIAYWYPQVAVYDDIDGWDRYNYSGQQEFYNDFSNFDVEIKVPNTFAVWGAGELQNPEELLNEKYLVRYNLAHQSEDVVRIVKEEDLTEGNIFNNLNEFNTWKYKADYVTDFPFALSDHYLWDGVSVIADSTTDRKVFVDAAYKIESEDFYDVANISKKSIQYFSFEMPGVPFPYPCLTAFNGSGGMEFPMMINDGSASTLAGTVGVTSHEIAHTYFPFYMGINESKYAFMDEGWAVMLPFKFQERMVDENYPRRRNVGSYQRFAGNETEMPPMIPSVLLKGHSYRTAAYSRPGIAYDFLREVLGDDLFTEALQEFIKQWNGKHPLPYD
ncbi:MAG: M1 family metallopeptidase, partial [Ignavibacteriaceae bacterium]|nr:M1 family metallopeptidase [Ignavibacteriaceae bacterium]